MVDYVNLNDEELQVLSVQMDSLAEAELVSRYNKLVKKCARPYFLVGGDSEDLIQEGMMGLLSAIRSYNANRGASFQTYADVCINNRLLSAIKSATRDKHAPLNNYVSLESLFSEGVQSGVAFFLRELEEQILAKESAEQLSSDFTYSLSKLEAEVLSLFLEGCSYKEIALRVDKPQKSVDNAIQRIRKKLTLYLESGGNSKG